MKIKLFGVLVAALVVVLALMITVPVSGLFAAIFFFTIRGMML